MATARGEYGRARLCCNGWINAYRFFSSRERIWPRGFPLERINEAAPSIAAPECERELIAPVQQGLVDGAPDVDAIWRLVLGCDFRFRSAPSVYLSAGAWCPINSQNTWWFPRAFPLLYLPSFVGFRITDIWRGFIAQRCLWEWGLGIVFHAPDMVQYRNPHSLMADFAAEIPAYLHNPRFCATLERTPLSAAPDAGGDNLHRCYVALIEAGFIPAAELPLVEAWLKDFALVAGGCGQTNG
ncbi:MAG: STELLO glycosyltransferase family protein [Gammaproteobacteria bacterium]